jgi:hypothetical protein
MARASARVRYEAGGADLGELVEAERAPLAVRMLTAEARATREARLAEMEELAGVDFDTLWSAPGSPAPEKPGDRAAVPAALQTEVRR